MKPNPRFSKLASRESIDKTVKSLVQNGIEVKVTNSTQEAKKIVLSLLPKGTEVFTQTSVTLSTIGLDSDINESGKYNSVRNKLYSMDRNTQKNEMKKMGGVPDYSLGSAHAVTEEGHIFIASNTGSQLAAEAYGADRVIFVVGTQKIVANDREAIKRIYEYSLPLERERAKKAYGIISNVNKILIINGEVVPGRITVVLVKENLGF